MKLLAFVDTHGSNSALKKLKQKAKQADIIICAGDFTIFEQNIEQTIKELDKLKKPILIIHGNHEGEDILRFLCKKTKNITFVHEKLIIKNAIAFIGYGGGGFSSTDKNFKKIAEKLVKKANNLPLVLITHAPAFGTDVDLIIDENCGNKTISQFIKKHKPIIHISGHLHETAGKKDKIGKTTVVNPGPFGRIINIE